MYTCVCVSPPVFVRVFPCVCVCVCVCVRACLRACLRACVRAHAYTSAFGRVYVAGLYVGKRTCNSQSSRQMCRHGAVCDRGVCSECLSLLVVSISL